MYQVKHWCWGPDPPPGLWFNLSGVGTRYETGVFKAFSYDFNVDPWKVSVGGSWSYWVGEELHRMLSFQHAALYMHSTVGSPGKLTTPQPGSPSRSSDPSCWGSPWLPGWIPMMVPWNSSFKLWSSAHQLRITWELDRVPEDLTLHWSGASQKSVFTATQGIPQHSGLAPQWLEHQVQVGTRARMGNSSSREIIVGIGTLIPGDGVGGGELCQSHFN